jgi:large subunit ribosomal protein L4
LLVGGGRAFGPKPRDYGFKVNKKTKALARKSALSLKAKNSSIVVIEDLEFDAPKTKSLVELTKSLQLADKKLLFVLPSQNKNVYLSARNLGKVNIVTASDLNTYAIMDATNLVITESSVAAIDNLFKA